MSAEDRAAGHYLSNAASEPEITASEDELQRNPTYHNTDAVYVLPNDAPEHKRLDEQHYGLEDVMDGDIIQAPLSSLQSSPVRMLDIGCGTATVYGMDLSPVPPIHAKPPNVQYLLGDIFAIDESSPLKHEQLDYIFSRMLIFAMNDWSKYFRTVAGLLKPGGYMEVQEVNVVLYDADGTVVSDKWEWSKVFCKASEKDGFDYRCGSNAAGRMREAGFVDVKTKEFVWPLYFDAEKEASGRGQEKGAKLAKYGFWAIPMVFYHALPRLLEGKVSKEKIQEYQEQMKKDVAPREGSYWKFSVTVGRKPEA